MYHEQFFSYKRIIRKIISITGKAPSIEFASKPTDYLSSIGRKCSHLLKTLICPSPSVSLGHHLPLPMAASQLLWKGCLNIKTVWNCTATQAINSFPRKEAAAASQCPWNVWKYLSKHDSGFIVSSINIQTFPLLIKSIGSMKCLKDNAYLPPIQFLMQLLLATPQMLFP